MSWLERTQAPDGQSWMNYLQGETPKAVDKALAGRWGQCLVAAVVAEHTGGPRNAAGQVIDHLCRCGYDKFAKAADHLESAAHKAMKKGMPLPIVAPGNGAQPVVNHENGMLHDKMNSSCCSSSGSSGGSTSDDFPEELRKLITEAPLHAHI